MILSSSLGWRRSPRHARVIIGTHCHLMSTLNLEAMTMRTRAAASLCHLRAGTDALMGASEPRGPRRRAALRACTSLPVQLAGWQAHQRPAPCRWCQHSSDLPAGMARHRGPGRRDSSPYMSVRDTWCHGGGDIATQAVATETEEARCGGFVFSPLGPLSTYKNQY